MDGPALTPEGQPAPEPVAPRRGFRPPRLNLHWGAFLRRAMFVLAMVLVVVPLAGVLLFRFAPPTPGFLVVERLFEGKGFDRRWRPLARISPNLVYGVIAAEDARFCRHHGFDGEAIEKALAHDKSGRGRLRGGSTISQQTAKNVFLWPGRTWIRKGLEAWYTVLIETVWGKTRIMEVYLNVVEWAPGVYGAEAASQRWFHVHADQLSPAQADRLAAILPSPLKWKASAPGAYVRRRAGRIGANAAVVREDDLAACVRRR